MALGVSDVLSNLTDARPGGQVAQSAALVVEVTSASLAGD